MDSTAGVPVLRLGFHDKSPLDCLDKGMGVVYKS